MKKNVMILLAIIALCLPLGRNLEAVPGGTTSDSNQRLIEFDFQSTYTYTVTGSGSFFYPLSIAVTFKPGIQVNTLDVNLIRNGVERDFIDYTYTGKTVIWYAPSGFLLKEGDQLVFNNSSSAKAVGTLNLQF